VIIFMNRDDVEQSNSIHGIIIKFLKAKKEPASMKEIVNHIIEQHGLDSKTPGNTVRSILQRSKYIKKNIYAQFELLD
jgi:hypothetical protein